MSYIIASVLGVFLLGSLMSGIFQRPSPFIDRKVAGQQIIRSDWTEIKVDEPPLEPVGDHQQIGLVVAEPLKLDLLGPPGVRLLNGALVLPEVELVTPEGVTVQMRYSGSRGKTIITYRSKDESIKHVYDRLRIRADQEVPLKAIYWTGFVIKNMR